MLFQYSLLSLSLLYSQSYCNFKTFKLIILYLEDSATLANSKEHGKQCETQYPSEWTDGYTG